MSSEELARYTTRIKNWLATCSHDHVVRCNQPGSKILPKRLICFESQSHRLIEIGASQGSFVYVALSYCWGEKENFKTTPSNLHEMEQEIPYDRLPKTLQDVFTLVRELGYRYLWVDALCIVQEDRGAEWKTEAAKMGDVYANADLVISASGSESVHNGLFVNTGEKFSSKEKTEFHRIMRTCRTMTQKEWHGGIKARYPLLCRGWAFQERLLARRIVHFTVLELIWECMEDRWCECGDEGKERLSGKINNMNSALKECRFDPAPHKHRLMWHECVQSFSKRDLTVRDDRLFAIAGIASYLRQSDLTTRESTADLYVHGMWKDFLPWDLVWYCDQTSDLKAEKPRSPSYSWISVDCGIEYPACPPTCNIDDRFSIAISTGTCLEACPKEDSTAQAKYFRAITDVTEHECTKEVRDAANEPATSKTSRLIITSSLVPITIQHPSWWSTFSTFLTSMASRILPWKRKLWQRPDSAQTLWRVRETSKDQQLPFWPDIDLRGKRTSGDKTHYYVRIASVENKNSVREVGLIVRKVRSTVVDGEVELYERVGLAGNMSCDLEKRVQRFDSLQKTRKIVVV